MTSRLFLSAALTIATLLSIPQGLAQNTTGRDESTTLIADSSANLFFAPSSTGSESSSNSTAASFVRTVPGAAPAAPSKPYRPFTRIGIDSHAGLGGVGMDIATPLAFMFNVRAGYDLFSYSTSFQEQGADITAKLQMRTGHASLDWFPFGGHFRLSPGLVFANNNHVQATALIPSGSSLTLNGGNYVSSATDPLHGSGSISFRKVSPGFTLGFGDLIPRTKSHLSFPIEAGFYYVAQPKLAVAFSGSACDPNYAPSTGCMSINQDASFQSNLAAFITRNNHNLSYASFFPVFSFGFGYSF
jgi:hypothetical protein